jgi:hypothetical protein
MARAVGSIVGSKDFLMDFFASAAVVSSQLLVIEPTTTQPGEVHNPAGTGSGGVTDTLDVIGTSTDAATVNTSPTREPGALLVVAAGGMENLVQIEANPFAILRFKVSGGAAAGTALAAGNPANIITITTADTAPPYATLTCAGTTGNVGTIDMIGGLVKGRRGNNVGSIRKLTGHVNSTSETVTTGFLNPIAVGDSYIRLPYSRMITKCQMTTDFTEMNGLISCNNAGAVASLGALRVVNVIIDEVNDIAWVDVVAVDHYLNPESS